MANAKCSNTLTDTNKLNHEENRLKTFNKEWPHAFISPHILAKTGFFYNGPYDQVTCFFCNIKLSSWEMGDNEISEHFRWSKNCPLINVKTTLNIPIEPISHLNELLSKFSSWKIVRQTGPYPETPIENMSTLNQNIKNYDFPDYTTEVARLQSFSTWPKSILQTPQDLSEAGFFYTQKMDRVICFSCGGGLCDWREMDKPWEQHALHYGHCNHLKLVKGTNYIKKIKEKFCPKIEE